MKIVVTGSEGFLGQHLINQLQSQGYNPYRVPSSIYDLRRQEAIKNLFSNTGKVDVLYHLAARVGGIGANRNHPGLFFYDNMRMGMNVIEGCRQYGVGKIIFVGTTCSYPKFAAIPFDERTLFDGYPEETNAPYGISKRALYVMLRAYKAEYGLDFNYLIPTNLYGPGDNFDDSTSHVIPALIKRFLKAKREGVESVTVWGSGKPTRDFVYVEDVARALVKCLDYRNSDALNLGSGEEVRISTVVHFIKQATGYVGQVKYDNSKPDGQPRRALSTKEARYSLDWRREVRLQEGLKRTVKWYLGQ